MGSPHASVDELDEEDEDDEDEDLRRNDDGASCAGRFTSHAQAVFRQAVHDFMTVSADARNRTSMRCEHCKAYSPVLRMEMKAMKVFQKPLTSTARRRSGARWREHFPYEG